MSSQRAQSFDSWQNNTRKTTLNMLFPNKQRRLPKQEYNF